MPIAPKQAVSQEEATARVGRLLTVGTRLPNKLRKKILECGSAAVGPLIEIVQDDKLLAHHAPDIGFAATHAVRLLADLGDPRCFRSLVDALAVTCADGIPEAILESAERFGPALIEPALDAIRRNPTPDHHDLLIDLLVAVHHRDDRIYPLLIEDLDRNSVGAIFNLNMYGDPRAIDPLLKVFDAVLQRPIRDRTANDMLFDISDAVVDLGGELGTDRQTTMQLLDHVSSIDFQEDWGGRARRAGGIHTCAECGKPVGRPVARGEVPPDEVQARVFDLLNETEPHASVERMKRIFACGEDAIGPLIRLVEDESCAAGHVPGVGYGSVLASRVLANLGERSAVRPILRALRHCNDGFRYDLERSLSVFPKVVEEPALEDLASPTDAAHRRSLLRVLKDAGARSEPIFQALVTQLDDDIFCASEMMASYGDRRALPYLVDAFEAFDTITPPADPRATTLANVGHAIHALGGALTEPQRRKLNELAARAEAERELHAPIRHDSRPVDPVSELQRKEPVKRVTPKIGRNDPCWCGSGRKYKKCHIGQEPAHSVADRDDPEP